MDSKQQQQHSTTATNSSSTPIAPSEAYMVSKQQQDGLSAAAGSSSSSNSSGGSRFIYTRSNHNSVLGIGAYAAAAGAQLVPLTGQQMDDWLTAAAAKQQQQQPQQVGAGGRQGSGWQLPWQAKQQEAQLQAVAQAGQQKAGAGAGAMDEQQQQQQQQQQLQAPEPNYHLVAYPAQDNYAGVVYPLDYINEAHDASSSSERYLVMLDAAAYLPSHRLDLARHPADFVAASFYKMFGYPTGLGALVLRTELVPLLRKVYFGGGSVALATPEGCWHVAKCGPGAALSDGTPNYLGAAALSLAYDNWDSRGGVQAVEAHTQALSSWLYGQLSSLRHASGAPLLQLYGRHAQQQGGRQLVQGAVFNFQVLQPDGSPVSYSRVEHEAAALASTCAAAACATQVRVTRAGAVSWRGAGPGGAQGGLRGRHGLHHSAATSCHQQPCQCCCCCCCCCCWRRPLARWRLVAVVGGQGRGWWRWRCRSAV
ncbi:pyridoxal phosphate-dependent transferase [Scenedesmus sp. NREL 46B-D3]|nr:pyridoxal phosphate-dependent transferase [Scenedesmus sp. NREL 46B-D3]